MLAHLLGLVTIALGLRSVSAQFVPTPSNFTTVTGNAGVQVRYKQVPNGICEQNATVKSFAGYADIAPDQHYFFWLFEARDVDPSTAPLTIWINGGPGSTSMFGLFQELGPCGVDYNGSVYNNPYSWSRVSNMVFIDNPVPVGFSYGTVSPGYTEPLLSSVINLPNNTCPDYATTCGTYSAWNISQTVNSTANAAPPFYMTLQGIIGAFPNYTSQDINFATESYGGHYGPIFTQYIVQQNSAGTYPKINLKNVLIGNGWYDPILSYQAYWNYTVSPGNDYTNTSLFNASVQAQMYNSLYGQGNCLDQLEYCAQTNDNAICMTADQFCATNVELVYDDATGRDEYDVRELEPDPFPYSFFVQYLNTPEVQTAVGAYVNFSDYSALVGGGQGTVVGGAFGNTGDDGREVGTIQAVQYLLQNNVSVTTYFGDADYNCNFLGGYATMQLVNASGWAGAGFANISVPGVSTLQGLSKQSGTFSYNRIFNSGHEVPFYQPQVSLAMFARAINRTDIATGQNSIQSGYTTSGISNGLFAYPEGNSTIQTSVVPSNYTYNTTTHSPMPPSAAKVRRAIGGRWKPKKYRH